MRRPVHRRCREQESERYEDSLCVDLLGHVLVEIKAEWCNREAREHGTRLGIYGVDEPDAHEP